MVEKYNIAAYTRISVDEEAGQDNTSIENQKAIIREYCSAAFPTSNVDFFEDRDKSGYTFDQRINYVRMRKMLFLHNYDILIVKDLSRFSRRTGKGLSEFEDLAEAGIRIISISESIDYPTKKDDLIKIKLYFFVNEMPVTDTSEKVSRVIASRQSRGEWICSVPYGYIISNSKKFKYEIDPPAADVVRLVFDLYNSGWGYKKIANYLTDRHVPTPRMCMRERKAAAGKEYRGKVKESWSIVTVSEILNNDFYIGTLRQRKYTRKKINGSDKKLDESENIVFENAHEPIIDNRIFAETQALIKTRSTSNYRGVKKYENSYSGLIFCGDCGSPMFVRSHVNGRDSYVCGTYHVRGKKGCSSHSVNTDFLDLIVRKNLINVRNNSENMIKVLEDRINNEKMIVKDSEEASCMIEKLIADEKEQLKCIVRQKTRDMSRSGANTKIIEQTYDELIDEAEKRIIGYENQLKITVDMRNTAIRANRIAKNVIELFDEIVNKKKLDKSDVNLIIEKIVVYAEPDRVDITLKPDIDELLKTGRFSEESSNFDPDVKDIEKTGETVAMSSKKHKDKVFDVNVISGGDPLEIYTDREGEVIFKKYSPIGELVDFASDYAETLYKTCGVPVVVCDRDAVIACAGVPKKDFLDKKNSAFVEQVIEARTLYVFDDGSDKTSVTDDDKTHYVYCAQPIFAEGDVIGCVASLAAVDVKKDARDAVTETKLIQTAASFLGRQLEM